MINTSGISAVVLVSVSLLAASSGISAAENRLVYSANNGTSLPGTLRKSEGQGPSSDATIEAAYENTGAFYQAFYNFWGRDSYDGRGARIISTVHYSNNYCNGFWDGSQLVFGDGNGIDCFSFAASVDNTAHQLTHAITELESGLIYAGESGGINESMSDIFGAFVEAWVDGGKSGVLVTSDDTWKHGEDVMTSPMRYLNDPAADGASADFYSSGTGRIDVHYSSGVGNLAFYLLSQGGVHPRGKSSIRVEGIGMEKAIRIFYEANVNLLTASSNYRALRDAAVEASIALGYDLDTSRSVACAFAAVGVVNGLGARVCGSTLTNGVPLAGLADEQVGHFQGWSIDVLAGQTLTVTLSGGSGNADLYVRADARPTMNAFDCRPRLRGNAETCNLVAATDGIYWIGVRTQAAYADVSLRADLSAQN